MFFDIRTGTNEKITNIRTLDISRLGVYVCLKPEVHVYKIQGHVLAMMQEGRN